VMQALLTLYFHRTRPISFMSIVCGDGPVVVDGEALVSSWDLLTKVVIPHMSLWFCRSHWMNDQPVVSKVEMVCLHSQLEDCWRLDPFAHRCRCRYEELEGLNISLDRQGSLLMHVAPLRSDFCSRSTLLSLCPSRSSSCFVTADAVRESLLGAASAEVWLFAKHPGLPQPRHPSSSFVIEVPRERASSPTEATLCLEAGEEPWSLFIPFCDGEDALAADVLHDLSPDGNAKALAREDAPPRVRASWSPGPLGSCKLNMMEASLEFLGENREPILLCQPSVDESTCVGQLPARLSAPREDNAGDPLGQYGGHGAADRTKVGRGAVRLVLRTVCADSEDDPLTPARSAWYWPIDTSVELWPIGRMAMLWYRYSPWFFNPHVCLCACWCLCYGVGRGKEVRYPLQSED